jgi:hypothetical protein
MKIPLALASIVLLGSTLAACGGGSDSGDSSGADGNYCKDLKAAKTSIAKVSESDVSGLDDAITAFHKLAAEAPKEVKSDWATLDGAFVKVEKAFADAGIKFSDLAAIQAGNIPAGADPSKLAGLASSFSDISSAKVTTAQKNIEKHAKSSCDVDLGATS